MLGTASRLLARLADSNETTQELAAKALSKLFEACDEASRKRILAELVKGLTASRKQGYHASGGDMSTYEELQHGMHPQFLSKFREGYQCYIDGNWDKARIIFEEVLEMPSANQYFDKKTGKRKPDGPTMQLMRFMSEHEFVAGKSWNGVHTLEGY